jgi:protein-S-isoprenylcysteine O-methyltransferase Ste14
VTSDPLPDNPGIVAFPGTLYAGAFVLAFALHLLWPSEMLDHELARSAGVAICTLGAALILWGIATMRAARTNIYPELPATALVTRGPFRFTRNPLYVALAVLFSGLSTEMNNPWGFAVLVPLLAVMHYGVILREERYLERKFGDAYREYKKRVRRYV